MLLKNKTTVHPQGGLKWKIQHTAGEGVTFVAQPMIC